MELGRDFINLQIIKLNKKFFTLLMILLGIFSSVEFCTIAIVVAAAIIGFLIKPKEQSPAFTYIFSADIDSANPTNSESCNFVKIISLADGTMLMRRHNVMLPDGASCHITADIVGDKLRITEKHSFFSAPLAESPHDISVKIDCLKTKRYHLRYDIPDAGLWGVAQITNLDGFSTTMALQY